MPGGNWPVKGLFWRAVIFAMFWPRPSTGFSR
jgi:hypothetical protein